MANMHVEDRAGLTLNDNSKSKGELDGDEIHLNDAIDSMQEPMEVVWT